MKKVLALAVLVVLMVCPAAWPSEYAEGEVLAVFRVPEGVKAAEAKITVAGAEVAETYEALSEAEGKSFVLIRSGVKTTQELIDELKQNPDVISVSPNYKVRRQPQSLTPSETQSVFPNDPSADLCWGLRAIRAPEVWADTTGSKDIYVCVVDTGIYRHPDLEANLAGFGLNTRTVSGEYDLTFGSWDADFIGHGTHVAGTIGAVGNNGLGVSGVNWNVNMIPVRVFDNSNAYETINFEIRGLNYIVSLLQKNPDMKLAALNFSLGAYLPLTPKEMQNDVYYMAYQALDNMNRTLIVVGAGNSSLAVGRPAPFDEEGSFKTGYYCYPAGFAGLKNFVVVGAMVSDDTAASFTNWGDSVDIAAPGYDILSTYSPIAISAREPGMYYYASGTSMATPHVTGAAALLMSAYPDATPAQIKAALLDGANRDKNPLVYPYAYRIEQVMKETAGLIGGMFELGIISVESRDAMIEEERLRLQEKFAKYAPLDGTGRVSRTGLLDVKAAYDLLGERVKPLPSSSGGCNAGYTAVMVLAVILGLAMIPEKR